MPRPYHKQSPYWNDRKSALRNAVDLAMISPPVKRESMPTIVYETIGQHFTAGAACGGGNGDSYRDQSAGSIVPADRYPNIDAGMLPWDTTGGYTSMTRTIILIHRAYANIAIFRNAVESCVEFSNSQLHIKTSNKTVKDFFAEWFSRVGLYNFSEQWFREYYGGGNVFAYKFVGRMAADKFGQMKSAFGAKNPSIPIRYIILNPAQVCLSSGISTNTNYVKVLSRYEIEKLKVGATPEDKQVFNSLPDNIKKLIRAGGSFNNIYMPLDKDRLLYAFYKKQDYMPFAVPMGYPVMNDIEHKLELKKVDMSLARTMEHVLLVVTTGEKVDQYGGGINPQNVQNLKSIFQNQTIGRTLVADYTTKAQWAIPDISTILGPEKYVQVEKDIAEGLSVMILGGSAEKFANSMIKAKIFLEKLKEGQRSFLNNFLYPEAKQICEAMGFREVPQFEFEEMDLNDTTQKDRVLLRLAELGILTPEEVFTALESGVFPQKDISIENQKAYKALRDKGMYLPLVGASAQDGAGGGSPGGKGGSKPKSKVGPIGTKAGISAMKVTELSLKGDVLKQKVEAALKARFKVKKLNAAQKDVIEAMAKAIMVNEDDETWLLAVADYVKAPKELNPILTKQVDAIAEETGLDFYNAAIVFRSQIEAPAE